jgi:hypothetical protein
VQTNEREAHTVLLAYQPPASSIFLSEQTSHQQPVNITFLSQKISTNHRPPVIAKPSDTMVGVLALHAIRHATLVTCLLSWALRRREVLLGFRGGTSIHRPLVTGP